METLQRLWLNVIAPTLMILALLGVMALGFYWLGPS